MAVAAVAPTPPAPVTPAAFSPTLVPGNWDDLPGWKDDDVSAAWSPFLTSCRGMASRPHGPAWKRVCELAKDVDGKSARDVRAFFEKHLRPYAVLTADGAFTRMFTGYYEPRLRGSRLKAKGYEQPVRAVPDDLLTIDLSAVFPELKDKRVRGGLRVTRSSHTGRGRTLANAASSCRARRCSMSMTTSSCSSCKCRAPGGYN